MVKVVLMLSLIVNASAIVTLAEQQRKLDSYEKYCIQIHNWSGLVSDALAEHHDNGGEFRISKTMEDNMEAFAVFSSNDMV